ncbi:MAG: type II toxin-antitoxin system Phd/YefM family antitoxin [Pirellulales bacterium]|nr:type II toxin-antitoxin system Phd/YefM family antitoxin [Pirellulales bacterium]
MITVSLDKVQQDFLAYVRRAQAGESIIIAEGQQPIAQLEPVATASIKQRPFGLCGGEFVVPDDFDAPLPEAILRTFEGE